MHLKSSNLPNHRLTITDSQKAHRSRPKTTRPRATTAYDTNLKPVADRIPGDNLCRLRVNLDVERESLWLAAERHRLVHGRHRSFLCCGRPSRWLRSEDEVFGESHTTRGSCDRGLNMEITKVRIRPANDDLVKAYASICLDHCFLVHDIKVINGPRGLFISFPTLKLSDGSRMDIAFAVNFETRNMIEQAILAEYKKIVAGNSSLPHANAK